MTKQKSLFTTFGIIVTAMVILFGVSSFSVYAQSWKEPSTTNPSSDPNASNVPDLIRVQTSSTTPVAEQNKQAIEGKLRIGSASSTDLFSALEVYGDVAIQNALLIDGDFGGSVCTTVECTNGEQFPAFLVQQSTGAVGIGTNALGASRLHIRAQANEFPAGALYAQSTGAYGIWARTGSGSLAGITASASGQNSIAVFGKAVDVQHRGIYADKGVGASAIAAQFKGNLLVVGGFIQADGTEAYRVGSIADAGLPQSGQIGMSVWSKRGVTVSANATTNVNFNFPAGEGFIIKHVSILFNTTGNTYRPLYDANVPGVTASVTGTTLAIVNSTGTTYNNTMVFAHVQSGVAVAVYEYSTNPPTGIEIGSSKAVAFSQNGTFELGALVTSAPSQNFNWKLESGAGTLCPVSNPGSCNDELTTTEHVLYQMPGSFPSSDVDKNATITISWEGGTGIVTKTFVLNLVDFQIPDNTARSVEMTLQKQILITTNSALGTPNLLFEVKVGSSGSVSAIQPSTVVYTAPNSLTPAKHTLIAKLATDQTVRKEFEVYVVPKTDITTTFPNNPGDPQPGQATNYVAINKDLQVSVAMQGSPNPNTIQCQNCLTFAGTSGTYRTDSVGDHQISFVWTPNASMGYPAGFSYAKSKTITAGHVTASAQSRSSTLTYVYFYSQGYPSLFLEDPIVNNSGNTLTFTDGNKSAVVGGEISANMSLINVRNESNRTAVTFSATAGTASPLLVRGRSKFDLREYAELSMTIPAGSCVCLGGPNQPICCSNVANEEQQIGGPIN